MLQYCSYSIAFRFTAYKQTNNRLGHKVAILFVRTSNNMLYQMLGREHVGLHCASLIPTSDIKICVSDLDPNELIGCVVVLSSFHNLDVLVHCEHMNFDRNFLASYASTPAYHRIALPSLYFDCDHQRSPLLTQ